MRKQFCLFFFILLVFIIPINSQTSFKIKYDSICKLDCKNEKKISEIKKLINRFENIKPIEIADAFHKLGSLYYGLDSLQLAIRYTQKSINFKVSLSNIKLKSFNNSLSNINYFYNKINNKEKGVEYLKMILKNKNIDKFYLNALLKMAYFVGDNGDYFKALEYLDIFMNSFNIEFGEGLLIDAHFEYIYILSMEDVSKIDLNKINNHKLALEKLLDPTDNEIGKMYHNIGAIYHDLKNKKKAAYFDKKALNVYLINRDSTKIAKIYTNFAINFSQEKQYKKADFYYKKALTLSNNKLARADVYNNQGYYLVTNNPKDKIKLFQKAINTVLEIKNDNTITALPSLKQIIESSYKTDILHYLTEKTKVWIELFEKENKKEYLLNAKKTLYLIDHLVSAIRLESSSDKSKLFWIHKGVNTYMLAIKVCYLLNEPSESFYFMEKNKSLLLLENLDKLQLKHALNIPEQKLQKERDFKYKILEIEHQLQKIKNKKALQNSLVKTNSNYLIFKDSLKNEFPLYYNSKKDLELFTLKESVEKHVSKKENLIEYMLNDENGYGIFCSTEETLFFKIEHPVQLIKDVKELKNQLRKPFVTQNDFEIFKKLSHSVFKQLFPFKDALNKLKNKKLTIISDYELQNFPFSTLIVTNNKTDKVALNYLIKTTEISYLHSTSVFQQLSKSKIKPINKIIGFAPITFMNNDLPPLKTSEIEMNKYVKSLPFTLKLKEKATKESFISSLKEYDVIHVNTHAGYTKNKQPWLSFYDETIDLNELYELENNSNLVILDACKTAQGEMHLGEGIASLSRGFFYGGSKSVLASQWNVNEQSNSKILSFFYKELKRGKSKSKALQNAKLNYLETNQLEQLSPYFWASMTLTGNSESLVLYKDFFWMKISSIFLIVFIGICIFFRLKFKKDQ